jgi:hypothetical protein
MEEPQTAGSQSGGRRFFFQLSCNQASLCNNKTKFSNFEGLFSNKVHKKKRETKNNLTQLPKGKNLTYLHDLGSS